MWQDFGSSPPFEQSRPCRFLEAPPPPFLKGPGPFIWHYVRQRPWHFAALVLLVGGAASAAVGAQYTTKLLVDTMTERNGAHESLLHGSGRWRPEMAGVGGQLLL